MRESIEREAEALQGMSPPEQQARLAELYRRMVEASIGQQQEPGCGHLHPDGGSCQHHRSGSSSSAEAAAAAAAAAKPAMAPPAAPDGMSR